jgi:ElaB protein
MEPHLDTTHVRKVKRHANASINDFLDNVDDLTKAIKDVETPEIAKVRAKVKMALSAAKSALYDGAAQVRGQARQVTRNTDTYVRDNPWQVVGIAAVVGVVLGVMMSRRSD